MSINLMKSNPMINNLTNTSADIYTDLSHLNNLKQTAIKDSQAALPEAARQFEAVMITMMMKSLRQDGMEDPLFSSQAEESYRDMYDQQLGLELSKGRGIGLAESIVQQMQQQEGKSRVKTNDSEQVGREFRVPRQRDFYKTNNEDILSAEIVTQVSINNAVKNPLFEHNHSSINHTEVQVFKVESSAIKSSEIENSATMSREVLNGQFESPQDFVEKLWPMAEKAAEKLGVTADVIISQAALETGWGKHIITTGQNSSFNIFNIKANHDWAGERMEKSSLEFVQGRAIQQKSDFRAYSSLEESFEDYVSFLKENPRYQSIFTSQSNIAQTSDLSSEQLLHDTQYQSKSSYIEELQKAGYATDPAYAKKVLNVLKSDVIQAQVQGQSQEINASKWR